MGSEPISAVSTLLEAGNVDTVYRDVYLERARTLLSPVLSLEDFQRIERERSAVAELPLAVARALEGANWPLVKELSQRTEALKQAVEGKSKLIETARAVYAVTDVRLDPFCHSLQRFTKVPATDLPRLRTRVVEQLTTLEESDVSWRDFYAGRRAAFQTRAPIISERVSDGAADSASPEDAQEAAAQALKAGDMRRLERLADLMATVASRAGESAHGATAGTIQTSKQAGHDLVAPWSSDTLTRARQLGLGPRHLEPRGELASLRQYAWNPLSDESGHIEINQVSLPAGSPGGLRDRLEVLMIHPLVNSGGTRHLPTFVAEDVLVEGVPHPRGGGKPPAA